MLWIFLLGTNFFFRGNIKHRKLSQNNTRIVYKSITDISNNRQIPMLRNDFLTTVEDYNQRQCDQINADKSANILRVGSEELVFMFNKTVTYSTVFFIVLHLFWTFDKPRENLFVQIMTSIIFAEYSYNIRFWCYNPLRCRQVINIRAVFYHYQAPSICIISHSIFLCGLPEST